MATEKETIQSELSKIASLAPTATVKDFAYLAEGSKYVTQATLESDLISSQATAKQAIIDRAKVLLDAETSAKNVGYLNKVLDDYVVKSLDGDNFIPMDLTKPMGGIWDESNDTWYQLGHDIPVIQNMMRRVVCTGNPMWGGSIYRYLNDTNSAQFEDGSDATAYVAGGSTSGTSSTYQVYTEVPKFYYIQKKVGSLNYFAIALAPFTIKTVDGTLLQSETHIMFRKNGWTADSSGTNVENEFDYNYVTSFEGVLFDTSASLTVSVGNLQENGVTLDTGSDKIISVANLSLYLQPCSYITRANARLLHANATNKQWHWNTYSGLRLLYLCEYKNHNSQATIGGYTEGGSYSYSKVAPTGTTLSLGNKTGVILNDGSVIPSIGGVSTSAVIGMSYRGIENIFGNLWKWCDGVNFSNRVPYVCDLDDAYLDDIFTGDYVLAGDAQPSINGYQSTIQDGSFFVKTIGSSSSKDITDYYYQNSGNRVLYLGGSLHYGSLAGLSFLYSYGGSSSVYSGFCSR